MRPLLRCLLLTPVSFALMACASLKHLGGSSDDGGDKVVQAKDSEVNSKKATTKEADGLKGKLQARHFKGDIASRSMQKWKSNAESGTFSGKVFKANNAYSAQKAFHTQEDTGLEKGFSGSNKNFKTDNYAGGDRAFKDAQKAFKDGEHKSKWNDKSYATKDSSMSGKMSKDNDKMFSGRDSVFTTHNNGITSNAMDHLKKPQSMGDYHSMSEADVQKYLNKN